MQNLDQFNANNLMNKNVAVIFLSFQVWLILQTAELC